MSKTNGRGGNPTKTDKRKPSASKGAATKLTAKTVQAITKALGKGASYKVAAAYGDISEGTMHQWRKDHPEFSEQVKRARAEAVMARVERIETAAKSGSWQADAWWLERAEREDWGRHEKVEHTGDGGGPVVIIRPEYKEAPSKNGAEPGRAEVLADLRRKR